MIKTRSIDNVPIPDSPHPTPHTLTSNYDRAKYIEEIRQKISDEQFEFSKHAVDQSIVRKILVREVREAISNGRVIEDYPDDK